MPFAFGLALSIPDDRLARSRLLSQQQPRWELYDNRVQRLYFSTNLAIAPVPWLRIGGGFTYIASTRGDIGLAGRIPVAVAITRDGQKALVVVTGESAVAVRPRRR